MSFVDQMSNLRTLLEETKRNTKQAVGNVKKDAHQLQKEAQKLVRQFASEQKVRGQSLRQELKGTTQRLEGEVKQIRGNNIRQQREKRREFAQAKAVFWGKE